MPLLASPWRREAALALGATVALGLLGWRLGALREVLCAGALLYLAWHLFQLNRLRRWLKQDDEVAPPAAPGIWGAVFQALHELDRRNRKRKRKLNRMLRRFNESTAALPDATVILGPRGEAEWWNEAAERLLGLRWPEHQGQRIGDLVASAPFAEFLEAGDYRRPLELSSPAAPDLHLTVRVVPYAKHQRLLQARDNTRLHQLEQVRRDFVANVSHELRTPLTVVNGYVEALLEDPESASGQLTRVLSQMHQQTHRMQRIVEDLLLLSRLESDQGQWGHKPVPVATLLEAIRQEAVALSGVHGHHLEVDADATLALMGNAGELRSAFSNLVFNAVRYTPDGGHILMRWWGGEHGAYFSVTDTGVGIAAEHLPRLTERFYRVDVARSRSSGGTGLGLAIVKHVLTRHEARLQIESDVGKGSTFTCHFAAQRVHWSRAA